MDGVADGWYRLGGDIDMDRMQDMESFEYMDDGWGKDGGYGIFYEMVGVDLEKGVIIPFAKHNVVVDLSSSQVDNILLSYNIIHTI